MGNFKEKMRKFMLNRSGPDNLSTAMIISGLVCTVISMILAACNAGIVSTVFNIIGLVLLILCMVRMLSRDKSKRQAENRRYIAATDKVKNEMHQGMVRFKNRKEYKYFKCPNCKVRMKLPRGKGIVTVTCGRCHNSFTQKS